jgi:hypothetical protein
MKESFTTIRFNLSTLAMIEQVNEIVEEYQGQGFTLTVRQLYYQLVARDIIENTVKSYHRIVNIVNDARMAGMIDWAAIEDRTRSFRRKSRWSSGGQIISACAQQYHEDMWNIQDYRPFVVIEKEALVGVLEQTCHNFDTPLLAARGYPSASVLYDFVKEDILPSMKAGQTIKIIHLGDHDPSGIDMTRDLRERILTFCRGEYGVEVDRIALNMDQVEEQKPPPNPAKTTDARFAGYEAEYGRESWELDALQPAFLAELVRKSIETDIEPMAWNRRSRDIQKVRTRLAETAIEFDEKE